MMSRADHEDGLERLDRYFQYQIQILFNYIEDRDKTIEQSNVKIKILENQIWVLKERLGECEARSQEDH